MKKHDFYKSLGIGKEGEAVLDAFLEERFDIRRLTREEERLLGADRSVTCRETRRVFVVEYKTDSESEKTGNAYLETISVDATDAPGWAVATRAQVVLYYTPYDSNILVLDVLKLKTMLPLWQKTYETKPAWNKGYKTWGVCVPLVSLGLVVHESFRLS